MILNDIFNPKQRPFQAARDVGRAMSAKATQTAAASELKGVQRSDASITYEPKPVSFLGREYPFPARKGALVNATDTADRLTFHFNPPELSQNLSTDWTGIKVPGYERPIMQWMCGGDHEVPLRLFFLDFWRYGEDPLDVESALDWLMIHLWPKEGAKRLAPDLMYFVWGNRPLTPRKKNQGEEKFAYKNLKIDRTQFDLNLVTVRATAELTLIEFLDAK